MLKVEIHYPVITYNTLYLDVAPGEAADIMVMSSDQKREFVKAELAEQWKDSGTPLQPMESGECIAKIVGRTEKD